MDTWQILHIPDNPPIAPDQQPTVDVIASLIDPKFANTLVRRLNQISPLENLRHVKRVKKKFVEGGKTQLSVILCLASENGNQLESMQNDVQELMNSYKLSPFITKVCKYAALSKEEWEEQCKLWPTSYHPPTYNIDGITGFSEEDSQSVFRFMKYAIQLAKSSDNLKYMSTFAHRLSNIQNDADILKVLLRILNELGGSGWCYVVNAAVIVDPSVKQVITTACDQTCSSYSPTNKITLETSCCEKLEAFISHSDSDGVLNHETVHSNSFPDKSKQLCTGVSCLYPWQWADKQSDMSSCYWHPLRHAAIVAIESSAARDRYLFPSLGKIQDKSFEMDHMQSSSAGSPAKRQKTNSTNVHSDDNLDANGEGSSSLSARPYLCTGFDMYLVWEPCIMCAMALVHQRIRRIFFAFPNPNAGALGSVHRLQGERSLNHHYAVFRVLVPQQILSREG